MKPRLSVIVPSYNTGKFVEATLDSIFGQDFNDFECIVIDGGSTDGTLEKLKKYPQAKIVSEKDRGYFDAVEKGIRFAQGEYLMHCCISDGYLDMSWFRKCVAAMDMDKEVSLVWGLPQYMNEDGDRLAVSFPQFHNKPAPQKQEFFYYWLASSFWLPEGNFCIRTEVMRKCFPPFNDYNLKNIESWLRFNFMFEKEGYLALFLPTVANYGRIHGGQWGEREGLSGASERKFQAYLRESHALRRQLLTGQAKHIFKDGSGHPAPYAFSRTHFIMSQFLSPEQAAGHAKRLFLNAARRMIFFLESKKMMPQALRKAVAAKRRAKAGI